MKSKTLIKLSAWALAIVINLVIALVFFNVSGLDGGFQTQLNKGAEAAGAGDNDKALRHYLKAVDIAPDSPVGYLNAADVYIRMGRSGDAITIMEELIERKPRSVDSFEYLLQLYQDHGVSIEKQIALLSTATALFGDASYADRAGELKLLQSTVSAPLTEPAEGSYPGAVTIQVTNFQEGDEVYYTTNGDTPTKAATKYDHAKGITLRDGRTVLSMIRYNAQGNSSASVAYSYSIGSVASAEELKHYTSQNGPNIATGGIAVLGGSTTYFSDLNNAGRLTSSKGGTLGDDKAQYINLVDGYLYYVNGSDNNRIYRIKTDGSDRRLLVSDACGMLHAAGDRLFYQSRTEGGGLYSAALDGSGKKRITPDLAPSFTVYEGYVYYRNDSEGGALYRSSIDGFEQTALTTSAAACVTVYEGYVYYISSGDDGRVYRMSTQGGSASAVTTTGAAEFVLSGGTLFFRGDTQAGIYRCNASGGSVTKLTDDDGAKLSVTGGVLYFVNYTKGSKLYTMTTSGGSMLPVENEKGSE